MTVRPGSLHLNKERGRILGVCAGIADWLDVPATLVRIVFVICVVSWPTLIIGYFILYLCLDRDLTPDRMRSYFANAKTAEHFRQLDYRKPIYKNSRNKRIAGVCAGIADYLEVNVFAVRMVALLCLFMFGPFTFWAYIICAFVFESDPFAEPSSKSARRAAKREARRRHKEERRARRHGTPKSYVNEGYAAANEAPRSARPEAASFEQPQPASAGYSRARCTEIFSELELRLREIEAYMTSKRFRLHCEIKRI